MVISTDIIKGLLDGLRPIARMTPSEWADEHRYLSSVSSAEPGRWRTARAPYLKEIMDRFSQYDEAQEIIVMKGSQIGFTELGLTVVGYYIDLDPGPIMYVMPTVETVKRNSKMRVDPMIQATPRLREKVQPSKSRDGGNTLFQKDFNGGTLILSGANSAASLRSVPIRTLVLDEVDGFPDDLDGEGSPVELAKARTRTFSRKKIFMLSSPTIEGSSVIAAEYEATSQRKFFVPCPHCEEKQVLEWDRLRWEKGKPETVLYHCCHCEKPIEERFKAFMLSNGVWQDTKPQNASVLRIGYHLNSLYSPLGWYSWREAAADWEKAQKDTAKLKTFVNTVLGETWKEKGEAPDWENLYNRRVEYKTNAPPAGVVVLTAGVDVQADRLEIEIVGWCKGKVSYSIDYRVLIGDPSEIFVWDELAKIVNEKWQRVDGTVLGLSRMAIDTGYKTTEVYKFCRRFHVTQVIPIKGQDRQPVVISTPQPVDRKGTNGKRIGALSLFNVGVSILKSEIYGALRLKIDEGKVPDNYCFFPTQYDEHYFKMLTAEQLQKEIVKGFTRYVWVKIRERNEALDCFDGETEVLTRDGWRHFAEIGKSSELATVNLNGNVLEWQKPSQIVSRHHSGEMLRIEGKRLDIMVTPKHRMVVSRKKKVEGKWRFDLPSFVKLAKELDIHDRILTAPDSWMGDLVAFYRVPASIKADNGHEIEPERMVDKADLASFMGWFVSEGGVFEGEWNGSIRRRVEISQTKKHEIEKISACLEKLPWKFRVDRNNGENIKFVCHSKQLFDLVRDCGHATFEKRVPKWIKESGPEVIKSFLDSAISGDGHCQQKEASHRPFRKYYTVSKLLADDVQELFLKIGKASNVYEIPEKEWHIKGRSGVQAKQFHVSEIHHTKASLDGGEGKREYIGKTVDFDGMVYCATVPNGTLIVRRNGKAFVCGNCRVYARAAASVVGVDRWKDADWDTMNGNFSKSAPTRQNQSPGQAQKRRSDFWKR